jgi:hypothetical protein
MSVLLLCVLMFCLVYIDKKNGALWLTKDHKHKAAIRCKNKMLPESTSSPDNSACPIVSEMCYWYLDRAANHFLETLLVYDGLM